MKNSITLAVLTLALSVTASAYTNDASLTVAEANTSTCEATTSLAKAVIIQRQLGFEKDDVIALAEQHESKDPVVNKLIDKAYTVPVIENPELKEASINKFVAESSGLCDKL